MPRFEIPEPEMAALIAYLKTLSAETSPGVTEETIHFATVTTEGTDASAMLAVLTAYFEDKNGETRGETRRAEAGPYYLRNVNRAYRKWVLHQWTLAGSLETWEHQLGAYYRAQPVFAMVSGAGGETWQPVHRFCEQHRIPCVLPNTDVPVVADSEYYTLYFSQGVTLEARTIATHLRGRQGSGRVLQVSRGGGAAATATKALRAALAQRWDLPVVELTLDGDVRGAADAVAQALAGEETIAIVAWVAPEDVTTLELALARASDLPKVYLSSTLLRGDIGKVPAALRRRGFVAHPFSLPADFRQRFQRVEPWLRKHGIPITDARMLAQTYFACRVLADALMHVTADYFYRDYFLEFVDHLDAAARFAVAHPSPSFGPGQRYISKGCHILDLARGDGQAAPVSTWIVP
jgi:hypothetical protein